MYSLLSKNETQIVWKFLEFLFAPRIYIDEKCFDTCNDYYNKLKPNHRPNNRVGTEKMLQIDHTQLLFHDILPQFQTFFYFLNESKSIAVAKCADKTKESSFFCTQMFKTMNFLQYLPHKSYRYSKEPFICVEDRPNR